MVPNHSDAHQVGKKYKKVRNDLHVRHHRYDGSHSFVEHFVTWCFTLFFAALFYHCHFILCILFRWKDYYWLMCVSVYFPPYNINCFSPRFIASMAFLHVFITWHALRSVPLRVNCIFWHFFAPAECNSKKDKKGLFDNFKKTTLGRSKTQTRLCPLMNLMVFWRCSEWLKNSKGWKASGNFMHVLALGIASLNTKAKCANGANVRLSTPKATQLFGTFIGVWSL